MDHYKILYCPQGAPSGAGKKVFFDVEQDISSPLFSWSNLVTPQPIYSGTSNNLVYSVRISNPRGITVIISAEIRFTGNSQ